MIFIDVALESEGGGETAKVNENRRLTNP